MGISDYFKERRDRRMGKLFDRANQNLENNLDLFGKGTINEEQCFSTVSYFTAEIISYGTELVGYERNLPVSRISTPAMFTSCFMILKLFSITNPPQQNFPEVINDRVFQELKEYNKALKPEHIDGLHQSSKYWLKRMREELNSDQALVDLTCKQILKDYQDQRGFDISNRYNDIKKYFLFSMNKYEVSLNKRIDFLKRFK